jgi:hypothetical protein
VESHGIRERVSERATTVEQPQSLETVDTSVRVGGVGTTTCVAVRRTAKECSFYGTFGRRVANDTQTLNEHFKLAVVNR